MKTLAKMCHCIGQHKILREKNPATGNLWTTDAGAYPELFCSEAAEALRPLAPGLP